MRYLVQRWHSGVRLGATSILTHSRRLQKTTNQQRQTTFQLGQPVSSQNFSNSHFQNTAIYRAAIANEDQDHVLNNPTYIPNQLVFNESNQPVPSTSRNLRSALDESPISVSTHDIPWSGLTPPSKDRSLRGSTRDIPISSRGDGK